MRDTDSPEAALYEATGAVTPEKAHGWVQYASYNM